MEFGRVTLLASSGPGTDHGVPGSEGSSGYRGAFVARLNHYADRFSNFELYEGQRINPSGKRTTKL